MLTITSVAPPLSYLKFIGGPVISGNSPTFTATNSGAGTIKLYTTTNLATPFNDWTPIWTNAVTANGTFTTNLLNAVTPPAPQQFYRLTGNWSVKSGFAGRRQSLCRRPFFIENAPNKWPSLSNGGW